MGTSDLKLNLWLKQRPRLMLCYSKADRGILIGNLLQVSSCLRIGSAISAALRVVSSFAGRGAAGAASMDKYSGPTGVYLKSPLKILAIKFWRFPVLGMGVWGQPGFVRRPSSVVHVRQNPSLCQEPSQVAKKKRNGRRRRGQRFAAPNGP